MKPTHPTSDTTIEAGTVFVKEDETSRMMYVIKSGKARVYKKYQNTKITIAHLGPGDVCGELALVDSRPRSASVEAITDLVVVCVSADRGENQISQLSDWAQAMLRTLANRIREADKQILGLRSIAEFQKKTQRVDLFSRTLYSESRRILNLLGLLHKDHVQKQEALSPAEFQRLLLEMVGPQSVRFDKIWQFFREHGIIEYVDADRKQHPAIKLDEKVFGDFLLRLDIEIQSGRFLMLENAAIMILQKILRLSSNTEAPEEFTKEQITSIKSGVLIPDILYGEGIDQLIKVALIDAQKNKAVFSCEPAEIKKIMPIQELIKRLDESSPADPSSQESSAA